MEILFIKICIVSACCGWSFVEKLTANYGLFDWLPKYYPRILERPLNCSFCVAGWLSIMAVVFFNSTFGLWSILYIFTAPLCTFVLVGIIDKLIIIPYK
jgi:hypothetical protein